MSSYKLLFISIVPLSWMEDIFLNKIPCISSWPGGFQFDTFLSVVLSDSRCVFTFSASSSPSNIFYVVYPFVFLL